jgi:sugar lactone lactonase YvrE
MTVPKPIRALVPSRKKLLWSALAVPLVLLLLAAWPRTEAESRVPSPLLPPQLEWVGTLHSAADVTPKAGLFKRFIKKVVGLDDRKKAMLAPQGLAVDAQGRVLVADTRERVVHVFDAARKKYSILHAPDRDPMLAPIAVALDGAGKIYVTDALRARIFTFRPDGKFTGTMGGISKNESIFKRCTGLAIDAQRGRMYVVDTVAMQVVMLDLDGKVINRIGRPGANGGEFNYPTYITVAGDGSFWVMDSLNFRVQHFSPEGKFLDAFGRLGDDLGAFDKSKGVALDSEGRLFVVEGRNDRVQVYDPSGRLLFYFGHTGSEAGEFFLPTGIAINHGTVYVADGYNRRVQIFHLRPGTATDAGAAGGR